jgi:hypothetical protein
MVYSIVRGGEHFRVGVVLVVRMRKGIKKKKNSQDVDQKSVKGREKEKRESRDITGMIKRKEHQAREKE